MCTEGIFLGFFALVLFLLMVVSAPLLVCSEPADLRVFLGAELRALRAGGVAVAAAAASEMLSPAPAAGGIACGRGCAESVATQNVATE
jgi:hypothetical protein